MTHPFGEYLQRVRLEHEKSIRSLARGLGVSHVYLSKVERGKSPPLTPEHWAKLKDELQDIDMKELERAAEISRVIEVDVSDAPQSYQTLMPALARKIRNRELDEHTANEIIKMLTGDD